MSIPRQPLKRLGARLQARFRSARPGSVLVLVVALLVLMALIGTAWLSTARIDRYSTRQAINNTQIDLLVDGVVNMVKASQLDDLIAGGVARPQTGGYLNADDPQADGFMGSRAPVVLQDVCPTWTTTEPVHPVSRGTGGYPDYRTPNLIEDGTNGMRPRKYFEGQFVRYRAAANSPYEYYLCTTTHIVGSPSRLTNPAQDPGAPGSGNPFWQLIGLDSAPPPAIEGVAPPPQTRSVYALTPLWPLTSRLFDSQRFSDLGAAGGHTFPTRTFAIPTYMTFPPNSGNTKFPAFRIYSPGARLVAGLGMNPDRSYGGLVTVPAADTDGDGVADAALFKLDIGTIEGLDYYAAVRVIDNNSAINVNTAFSQFADFDVAPPFALVTNSVKLGMLGAYKSHIGLYEWLNPAGGSDYANDLASNQPRAREMDAINQYRFSRAPATPTFGQNSAANNAVTFLSVGEAMETDFSRRLGNPTGQYRAFSVGDGMALGYHGGVLRNPDASLTLLERNLSNANLTADNFSASHDPVYDRLANRGTQVWKSYTDAPLTAGPRNGHPYDAAFGNPGWPSFIWRWFDENYNQWGYVHGATATPGAWIPPNNPNVAGDGYSRLMLGADQYDNLSGKPFISTRRAIRPFLVSRNPTSNQAPIKLKATPAGFPTQLTFGTVRPRASVNRSNFDDLWRAYWSVMAADWPESASSIGGAETPFSEIYRYLVLDNPPPATPEYGSWHNNPFIGMAFNSDSTNAAAQHRNLGATQPGQNPNRMFRSVLRPTFDTSSNPWNNSTPRMGPDQVMFLRSAIAAVNTMDLRDDNDDITVETVGIPASRTQLGLPGDNTPPLEARIYGIERQPYVTEVYADNNWSRRDAIPRTPQPGDPVIAPDARNDNGYVAIELHNPYPFPIDIRNCKIATINRQDANHRNDAGPAGYLRSYDQNYNGSKLLVVDRTDGGLPADEQIDLRNALTNMEQDAGGANYHDPCVIPADGYLILENYDSRRTPDTRAAQYRPPAMGVHPGGTLDRDSNPAFRGSQGPIKTQDPASFDPAILNRTHADRILHMNFAYVPNLDRVVNQEFVLVRPIATESNAKAHVAGNANVDVLRYAAPAATGVVHASLMAPLDSFDFTGLVHAAGLPARASAWHYSRANSAITGFDKKYWHFVYPGRYDGNKSVAAAGGLQRPRQQGTDEARELLGGQTPTDTPGWDPLAASHPWETYDDGLGGRFGAPPEPGMSFGNPVADSGPNRDDASYPVEFKIQISNNDFPGIGVNAAGPNPNGGFLREMDILQVPFIGAYSLRIVGAQTAPEVLELNALPMDASFAEDSDPRNDPIPGAEDRRYEQIGRFCPLPETDLSIAARGQLDEPVNFDTVRDYERMADAAGVWTPTDFWNGPATGIFYEMVMTSGPAKGRSRMIWQSVGQDLAFFTPWANAATAATAPAVGDSYEIRRGNYRWATDLFDYLTVHSPQEDAVPNSVGASNTDLVSNYGRGVAANDPVEGLININTAPWRVLASIPWTGATNDILRFVESGEQINAPAPDLALPPGQIAPISNTIPDNYDIARAIVAFRDAEIAAGADPEHVFTSIFDLCRVPGIQFLCDYAYVYGAADPDDAAGDLSPAGSGTDGVRSDFEEQYLFLNRVSNLITTRSDSFTNYILVQGWRGIGTASPELVVQRRRAFTSDRSRVTSTERDVQTEFFYNE